MHPRLQVVPFQHLYRLLEEEDVDAVIGFREPDFKKISAVYKEIKKVPVVCICAPQNPLARRQSVTIEDLKAERLILLDPKKAQTDVAQLQGQLVGGRPPAAVYFCESAEAAVILAEAGFGVSILPDLFIPPKVSLARIPIKGMDAVSFGIYYQSLQGNAPLKYLVQLLRENG